MRKNSLIIFILGILISTILLADNSNISKNSFRNSPPEIDDVLNQDIDEDQTLNYNLSATDPDNDPLTFDATIDGNGSVSVVGNSLAITPDLDFNGAIQVEVTVSDGEFDDLDTFILTVNPINDAPVSFDVNNGTIEDQAITVTLSATDVENDALSYSVSINPSNGNIVNNGNGTITYIPDDDFNGQDTFLYIANDGFLDSNESTVTINVSAMNDDPILDTISNFSFDEDGSEEIIATANDIDGDNLSYNCQPPNGNILCSVEGNIITFTAAQDYFGTETIIVSVQDANTGSDEQSVQVTVNPINDAPVSNNVNDSTVEEEAVIISLSATDVEDDILNYSITNDPSNGEIVNNGNGTITYTPNDDFNGQDTFNYIANDGFLDSNESTVTINVSAINDDPVLDPIADFDIDEDGNETIIVNASDPDGDNITYGCTPPLSFNIDCSVFGNQITFVPVADYFGTETVTISAQDGNGGDDELTVDITINPINDPPVLTFIPDVSFQEDSNTQIIVEATDVENDFLTFDCAPSDNISCNVVGTQITFTATDDFNGTEVVTISVDDGLDNDEQVVNITVISVNDEVELIDDIDDISVNEDSDDVIIDLANHFDDTEDGPNLTYSIVQQGTLSNVVNFNIQGTNLTIDFLLHKHGSDNVTLRACDSNNDCLDEIFNIEVISINDAPDLTNIPPAPSSIVINTVYEFLIDPSNADADDYQFNYQIISEPASGLNGGGLTATENNQYANFIWYPDQLGTFSITIEVQDVNAENGVNGELSDQYTWTVEVVATNDNTPPEIAVIPNQTIDEDNVLIYTLDITDADDAISDLTVNVYDEYTIHPSNASTFDVTYNGANWILTATPEPDWNGDINIVISVSDDFNSANKEFLLTVDPVNDTPTFEFIDEGEIEFNEDSSYTYNLYITDIDAHNYYNVTPTETIDYVLTTSGSEIDGVLLHDQLTFQNETNFYDEGNDLNQMTFTPIEDFYGTQQFNLKITDSNGTEYDQDFFVSILNVNDEPIIDFIDDYSFDEDTISDPIFVNAVDDVVNPLYADSDEFIYSCVPIFTSNVGCTVDGASIIFSNTTDHFFGTQEFRIYANDYSDGAQDGNQNLQFQDITVTVNPINDPPVALDINESVNEDGSVTFNFSATDVENHNLTYTVIDNPLAPENGQVTNNNDGTVTYVPNPEFNGQDTFLFYVVDDDTDSNNDLQSENNGTVTITVNPINDIPILDFVDDFSFDEDEEDEANRTFAVTATDIDTIDNLSFDCEHLDPQLDCSATLINSDPSSGEATITITSPLNYNGQEQIKIKVSDGAGGNAEQIIEVTVNPVNDAPVVPETIEVSTNEDTELIFTFEGTDVDGDDLDYIFETQTDNGLLVNNGDGTATYTPTAEYNGEDTFTYKANDGFLDSVEPPFTTVTITVIPENDIPVLDFIDNFSFNEDENITITPTAFDADSDDLTYSCNVGANLICTPDGDNLIITAPLNYNGIESITVYVNDGNGGEDNQVVEVTVLPVNDAPVVPEAIEETTNEDTELIFTFEGTDVDGDALSYTLVTQTDPLSGSIVNNFDGTATFTPAAEYNGDAIFTYKANDGFLDSVDPPFTTVTITVIPDNDDPVLDFINDFSFNEDETDESNRTITVTATDIENDILTYGCTGSDNIDCVVNANDIIFSSTLDYNGTEVITITVNDEQRGEDVQDINVTVLPINDPPVVSDSTAETDEEVQVVIPLQGSDVDGDPLTYSIVSETTNGILTNNNDGTVTYLPNVDFIGEDSFTFRANDGLLDSEEPPGTVIITVLAVNDAPVTEDILITVNEGSSVTFNFQGSDIDGDPLTYSVVLDAGNGTVVNNNDGTATYTPNPNYWGNDSFTYIANDGELDSNVSVVSIAVNPINDAPVLDFIANPNYLEDESLKIQVSATDAENDNLFYFCDTTDGNVSCEVVGDMITFSNAVDHFNGTELVTIYVVDAFGSGGIDNPDSSQDLVITVFPVNDEPITKEANISVDEDQSVIFNLEDYLINVDNVGGYVEDISYTIDDTGENGTCSLNEDGYTVTYIPNTDYPFTNDNNGTDICTFYASDIEYDSNISNINIDIEPINDAPVLDLIDDVVFFEDESYSFDISASDVDNDKLTYTCLPSDNISCEINGTTVTGTNIVENYYGTEPITIIVEDGNGGKDFQLVNVTVTFKNDAPVLDKINDVSFKEDKTTQINVSAYDPDPETTLFFSCENSDNIICEVSSTQTDNNGTFTSSVDFSAVQDFNGQEVVTVTVDDKYGRAIDFQIVTVNVIPVNDAPITDNFIRTINEDEFEEVNLDDYSSDVDMDALTYEIVYAGTNGICAIDNNMIIYTPNQDYPYTNKQNGYDVCSYKANDGNLESNVSTFNIIIEPINDAPVTTENTIKTFEDTPITFSLSDFTEDVESDPLTYQLIDNAKNGDCINNFDGTFTYIPNNDYPFTNESNGSDMCSFQASDLKLVSNISNINLIILPVNDNPELDFVDDVIFKEDKSVDVALSGSDIDNDKLSFGCEGTANIICSVENNILHIEGAQNFYGIDKILILVFDPYGGEDSQLINVEVIPVNDPPVLHLIEDISFEEGGSTKVLVTASDQDPKDILEFECIGSKHITCEINGDTEFSQGIFFNYIVLESESDFYGYEDITVIVDDGFVPNSRYTDEQIVTVNILNVNDPPKIKPISYKIDNQEDILIENEYNVSLNEGSALSVIFQLSDPDSLIKPDILEVNHTGLGLFFEEDNTLNTELIDLDKTCTFSECEFLDKNNDGVVEDDYAECNLNCHPDFNGIFIQNFEIDDNVTHKNLPSVDFAIDIKQVNDKPIPINLLNNIFTYKDDIDINKLQGPIVDEEIYNDTTKFYKQQYLTNSNQIPQDFNENHIYIYRYNIMTSTPSFYFIWERSQNKGELDVDTDPNLNQYPYELYYRLELMNDNDVYVIIDELNDSIFSGDFAYTMAEIDPDLEYPVYQDGEIYIPYKENLGVIPAEKLKNINGEEYRWRIVAQNYSSIDNNKIFIKCTGENEIWNEDLEYCMEFEDNSVISSNPSDLFNLDIQYTKGSYYYALNSFYIDHYDMYFVPDDNYVAGEIDYDSKIYLNYVDEEGVNTNNSLDDIFDIDFQEENNGIFDVFHLSDDFDEFGGIHIHIITIDEHGNTFINRSNFNYEYIYPNQVNTILAPSENAYIEFSENAFINNNARVLIYENEIEDFDVPRDNIVLSNLVTIQSNTELSSDVHIHFGLDDVSQEYSLNHIGISKIDNNGILYMSSYFEDNNIISKINSLGTYMMIYDESYSNEDDSAIIPLKFNIESCYPNPFNPILSINYSLDIQSNIKVRVYNILGQEVKTIYSGMKSPGNYTMIWNGTNNDGSLMPSGTYFIEFSNYKSKIVKSVTLLK